MRAPGRTSARRSPKPDLRRVILPAGLRITALVGMVTCLSVAAQGAESILTLACQGTTTRLMVDPIKPEPVSMGLTVNFTDRTVQGFGVPGVMDYPVKITAWNEVTVSFLGSEDKYRTMIRGSMDRVTGDVEATSMVTDAKTGDIVMSTSYALKCRPAQRMF